MGGKLLYEYFKGPYGKIALEMTCTLLRRRTFKKETEFILIAAENNARKTN